MNTGLAVIIGLTMVAAAVFAGDMMGNGRYVGSAVSEGVVWVTDTQTGAVRRCYAFEGQKAGCGPWSTP